MAKTVSAIPATRTLHTKPHQVTDRRRVAAYARVSTDMEEQASSYETQIAYYTSHIQSRSDWVFAGMYSDEGISGTPTKHREGFQHMIADALAGKIDLILTKSVSRFARNTVDSLTTVRQLKDAGVEVYFEKENIYTFDSKGELLITIMSSLAQEESRSISENVTWGHRRRFAEGRAMIPYSQLLGYTKGENGGLVIDESEAPTVRRIYAEFLTGKTPSAIATILTREGHLTPRGKTTWSTSTINSILRNEKYKGDALLQKTFTTDFLTKTVKKNEGEVPQYYVTGHHEPIIEPEIWEHVQAEIARRVRSYANPHHVFASMIRCGQCGGTFGRKKWHSSSKYERFIWRCNNKYEGKRTGCTTPHVTEDAIKNAFTQALAKRIDTNTGADHALNILEPTVLNTESLQTQQAALVKELEETRVLIEQLIETAATRTLNIDDFDATYADLQTRHDHARTKLDHVNATITDRRYRLSQAKAIQEYLATQPPLEYSDDAWNLLVDHATIDSDGTITICFADQEQP